MQIDFRCMQRDVLTSMTFMTSLTRRTKHFQYLTFNLPRQLSLRLIYKRHITS